jgi:hypothetical protein
MGKFLAEGRGWQGLVSRIGGPILESRFYPVANEEPKDSRSGSVNILECSL